MLHYKLPYTIALTGDQDKFSTTAGHNPVALGRLTLLASTSKNNQSSGCQTGIFFIKQVLLEIMKK